MKYRRTYRMLKAYGFSPAKATEIILDASRHDTHALRVIKIARAAS